MRWKRKPKPENGDTRYVVYFAWLPVTAGLEVRWLEMVSIKQRYFKGSHIRSWFNLGFEQQPLPDFNKESFPPPPPRQKPREIK